MLYRYFRFNKKRVVVFAILLIIILSIQAFLTGSLMSEQSVTTEAGNTNSAVIGIIDNEEIIRQKFSFNRKVVLSRFVLSFGSFERNDVGDTLHIQMTDGNNNIVYNTDISVDKIKANQDYPIKMDNTVTIPKGVTCCIRITCSSKENSYAAIPTLNTTNRTNPNTYMSTLKMQTHAKSLNIRYTYRFRQVYPLIVMLIEILILFVLCFEHISDMAAVYRKRYLREFKKKKQHENTADSKPVQNNGKSFVEFRDVTFGYDEHTVLKHLSFQVEEGEQITLSGRTGAGKSTVFKLLLGLYEPGEGSVWIDGREAAAIDRKDRRSLFGYVEQSFHRVAGTVKDQITLYDEKISMENVKEAAELTGLHDTIMHLPDGYDTICTPELFSQGQWQLLSIARAAAARPKLLLLDEITANLDAETEKEVLEALKRVSENRTVISISHRVSAKMGRIIPIEQKL